MNIEEIDFEADSIKKPNDHQSLRLLGENWKGQKEKWRENKDFKIEMVQVYKASCTMYTSQRRARVNLNAN